MAADLVEAEDLAAGRVAAALGHEAEAALRRSGQVLAQVVDPRLLVDDLVVADVAVALAGHVDHARVGVVEGHQDARRRVDRLHAQRRRQVVLSASNVPATTDNNQTSSQVLNKDRTGRDQKPKLGIDISRNPVKLGHNLVHDQPQQQNFKAFQKTE